LKTSETWCHIHGAPYEVSTRGRVRRIHGRVLSTMNYQSYPSVSVSVKGWSKRMYVHELVARAFLGPRPPKHDIDHKDGNPQNNHLDNLEYVTHQFNMRRSLYTRRGADHPNAKLTEDNVRRIRALDAEGVTCIAMMREFGIDRRTLYDVRSGKTWRHVL